MIASTNDISERIAQVRRRIADAAAKANRDANLITLVAISKTVQPKRILAAYEEGLTDFGENRVQEAAVKIPELKSRGCTARWHLVGHLQSNKALRAVNLFDVIESVDSVPLAERLNRIARDAEKTIPVLLELNLGGEEAKSGFEPTALSESLPQLAALTHLAYRGLMIIPPFIEDPELIRPYFRRARAALAEINHGNIFSTPLAELSMGMSYDFDVAIEEGATIVRVGTAIFGPRAKAN